MLFSLTGKVCFFLDFRSPRCGFDCQQVCWMWNVKVCWLWYGEGGGSKPDSGGFHLYPFNSTQWNSKFSIGLGVCGDPLSVNMNIYATWYIFSIMSPSMTLREMLQKMPNVQKITTTDWQVWRQEWKLNCVKVQLFPHIISRISRSRTPSSRIAKQHDHIWTLK